LTDRELNIVIISEGKPGHLSQSQGIANLVRDPKRVHVVNVNLEPSNEETLLRGLTGLNHFVHLPTLGSLWQRASQYISAEERIFLDSVNPDLIISAGTLAAGTNIILKKMKMCLNVVAMRPSLLPLSAFDLVVIPHHDFKNDTQKNIIVLDTSPNLCLPESIKKEETDFTYRHGINPNHTYWAVFLGGPSKAREFPQADVISCVTQILEYAKKSDVKLLITTSRRTLPDFEISLKKLCGRYKDQVAFLQIYHEMPEPTTRAIMSLSKKIFITEESVSMVSESIWANRETHVIPLPSTTPDKPDKISHFKQNLIEKNLVRELTPDTTYKNLTDHSSNPWDSKNFNDIRTLSEALNSLTARIV
jgi:mitochondrial fission protein ELM1